MGTRHSQPHIAETIHRTTSVANEALKSIGKTSKRLILHNFLVVWIDGTIDEHRTDCQHTLDLLRKEGTELVTFTKIEPCIDFLRNIHQEKVILITSGSLGKTIVPFVHSLSQIHAIYIFCGNRQYHQDWVKNWNKVKDICENIEPVCQAIGFAVKEFTEDSMLLTFPPFDESTNETIDRNQSETSFMYTILLKKIFLEIEHDDTALTHLITYYRNKVMIHLNETTLLEEFQNDYRANEAIRWYTRGSFLYQMINRALRLFEADVILKVGFFIRDLHHQLEVLHQNQLPRHQNKPFLLYRNQSLSMLDFEKLQNGRLVAFNSFLLTSKKRSVSLSSVESATEESNRIRILFVMHIDPTISSVPFVDLEGLSYFPQDDGVLFSMHTIFRIGEIKPLNESSKLYEVSLTLTSDQDVPWNLRTEKILKEMNGISGWKRLGHLLIIMGLLDKAEDLYHILLEQTRSLEDQGYYFHQLGVIKDQQAKYLDAIHYYRRSLQIKNATLPPTDASLAVSYNNLGAVYDNMGNYPTAVSYYEKTLSIEELILSPTDPNLVTTYANLGAAYDSMQQYDQALFYYDKALSIYQKILPANHPLLATAYNNVGGAYYGMQVLAKALSFYNKALEIRQKSFSANHPDIAHSYNDIGLIYDSLGDYKKALSYYGRALDIQEKALPSDHLHLAITYNNMGGAYYELRQYRKALFYFQKTVELRQKAYPDSHSDVQDSLKWVGMTKQKLATASVIARQNEDEEEKDAFLLRG